MPDIAAFYQYISDQSRTGNVLFEKDGEYGIPEILERFSLERLTVKEPELAALTPEGFRLMGKCVENTRNYTCTFQARPSSHGKDCICRLSLKLVQDGALPFGELYPAGDFYASLNFYAEPFDIFDKIFLLESVIAADTEETTETPLFSAILVYEEESFLYQNFKRFLPTPGTRIALAGEGERPFGAFHYIITGSYLKEISLPVFSSVSRAMDCELVINSHAEKVRETEGEEGYRCRTGVRLRFPVPALSRELWFDIDFARYGTVYFLHAGLEKKVSMAEAEPLLSSLSGKSGIPSLPGWANVPSSALSDIVLEIDGSTRQESINRIGLTFAADFLSLPIPFFDAEEGGAKGSLYFQWDRLWPERQLICVAGFYGRWKQHTILINVEFPDLVIQGIYQRDRTKEPPANGIFPGFMDLSVSYIRLAGNLSDHLYEMNFLLENKNAGVLPIGAHYFQIDTIEGHAAYSPAGLSLGITLEITLFTAIFCLEGNYRKQEDQQILSIKGNLARPFSLSDLISLITGRQMASGSLDLQVSRLSLAYEAYVPDGDGASGNSLKPVSFEFLCAIAFDWGGFNEIRSSFHMRWEKDEYRFLVTAGITLFQAFDFAASCEVAIQDGNASFNNFCFRLQIRSMTVNAVYDRQKNLVFRVVDFNLGELLEGLISLIAPSHNWYLPWPFTVLKQITLKNLEVTLDRQKETLTAKYEINLKILFLTVEFLELFYDYKGGSFLLNVNTNASLETGAGEPETKRRKAVEETGDAGQEVYHLDLLKNIFDPVRAAGKRLFSLGYLGVGQHIRVNIPPYSEEGFETLLLNLKESIPKSGRPRLDPQNNWVAALQLKLINAIDLRLLMCDPSFYGLRVDIGDGSDLVKQLAGLSFTILYTKVTETIGMFYAHLKFPEAFRRIDLGGIQIMLGEVGVWIYTNGNFKIDMGFPHNGDFSDSFGLTYLVFTGKGGFYFGILNGDTSRAVPAVKKGHFETVLELGIGISAGVGREIQAGPLKAGAYVMLVAIFEGVIANYVPEGDGKNDSLYYKVKACAGVTVSVYGSVDFVLLQVGFSVNASFVTDLVLERYRQTYLSVHLSVSVKAYIKILFIKVSFSFDFQWEEQFQLGDAQTPPWESGVLQSVAGAGLSGGEYWIEWQNGPLSDTKSPVCAEIVPYFTFDGPQAGIAFSGKRRIAFLALLHGHSEGTVTALGYTNKEETPFAKLLALFFLRALTSVRETGSNALVTKGKLEYLSRYLEDPKSFEEGFFCQGLDTFLTSNIVLTYKKSAAEPDMEIGGIPFPLFPKMELAWFCAPDREIIYDLEKEPKVDNVFLRELQEYYGQMDVQPEQSKSSFFQVEKTSGETAYSASAFLFAQYFYMLTKIAVSLGMEALGDDVKSQEELVELLMGEEMLGKASGMISRFCYGGSRVYGRECGTQSIYWFAHQEFEGLNPELFSDSDIIHRMRIYIKAMQNNTSAPGETLRVRLSSGSLLQNERGRDLEEALEWSFTKKDLAYPAGSLEGGSGFRVLPFYRRQEELLELVQPRILLEDGAVSFWELRSWQEGTWSVSLFENGEKTAPVPCKRGSILKIPLKEKSSGLYEIQPLGYEEIRRIDSLLKQDVIARDAETKAMRATNALDEKNTGFASIQGDVYLCRTNLCFEPEKPEISKAGNGAEDSFKNSAYLTEPKLFLSLLQTASMVNARGYYLKFSLKDRQILEDGKMTLYLWVQAAVGGDAACITHNGVTESSHPVVQTGNRREILAYEPGTFGFYVDEGEKKEGIKEQYQMMDYQILENAFFARSNESRPLFAQQTEQGTGFSQVVCACKLAKERAEAGQNTLPKNVAQTEDPYRGIGAGSNLKLLLRGIDLLGNREANGKTFDIPYGYTDPLLPITAYPNTVCTYELCAEDGWPAIHVGFRYAEGEQEIENPDFRLAYYQLFCSDMRAYLNIDGKESPVDIMPLRRYVRTLYEGGKPESVSYTVPLTEPGAVKELAVSFGMKREEKLLAPGLSEAAAAMVCRVASCIREDKEKTEKSCLARRGRDGQLFYVTPQKPAFTDYEVWALPPLSNRLLDLTGYTVKDGAGKKREVSYGQVDMGQWMDDFLLDMERFLSPDSLYADDRKLCEKLLSEKERLADVIAQSAVPLSKGDQKNSLHASDFYKNQMLQNLCTGYRMDGVILLQDCGTTATGQSFCFSAKSNASHIVLKPGKMKDSHILPVGICLEDGARQMHVKMIPELTLTDWELPFENRYDYLTVQKPETAAIPITADFPYKRFPELPVLKEQGYEANGEDFRMWEYRLCFAHKTAEQDIVTLRLYGSDREWQKRSLPGFLHAMVQYRFLRERFLQDASAGELLAQCCEDIAGNFCNAKAEIADGRPAIREEQIKLCFSLSVREKKLYILSADMDLSRLRIYMKGTDGSYGELSCDGDNSFTLPDAEFVYPYDYAFLWKDIDIRIHNRVCACAQVTRNQGIEGIDERFVYRSQEISFPDEQLPFIHVKKEMALGLFERENFMRRLLRIAEGFGNMDLEAYCRTEVSRASGAAVYSHLPLFYVPEISAEERNLRLTEIFDRLNLWIKGHFARGMEAGLAVVLRLTLYHPTDGDRSLVELDQLVLNLAL